MSDDESTLDFFPRPAPPDFEMRRHDGHWKVYRKGVCVWVALDIGDAEQRARDYLEQLKIWTR